MRLMEATIAPKQSPLGLEGARREAKKPPGDFLVLVQTGGESSDSKGAGRSENRRPRLIKTVEPVVVTPDVLVCVRNALSDRESLGSTAAAEKE